MRVRQSEAGVFARGCVGNHHSLSWVKLVDLGAVVECPDCRDLETSWLCSFSDFFRIGWPTLRSTNVKSPVEATLALENALPFHCDTIIHLHRCTVCLLIAGEYGYGFSFKTASHISS